MTITVNHGELILRAPATTAFVLHLGTEGNEIDVLWQYHDRRTNELKTVRLGGRKLVQRVPEGDEVRASMGAGAFYTPLDVVLHFTKSSERSVLEWLREWAFGIARTYEASIPREASLPGVEPPEDNVGRIVDNLLEWIEGYLLSVVQYHEQEALQAEPIAITEETVKEIAALLPLGDEAKTEAATPEAKQAAQATIPNQG